MAETVKLAIVDCSSKDREALTFNGKQYYASELLAMKVGTLCALRGTNLEHVIVRLSEGGKLIPEEFDGIIIPGSKLDIDTEGRTANPWMSDLIELIRATHDHSVPLLGICFGHQAIAVAFGSSIERVPPPANLELGFINAILTEEGKKDPLFEGIPQNFQALSYHYRTVESEPKGSVVLSKGKAGQILQSYRIGMTTWGVQFHPDYSQANLMEMIDRRKDALIKKTDLSKVIVRVGRRYDEKVLANFLDIVLNRKKISGLSGEPTDPS